jgi:hypothetical protein
VEAVEGDPLFRMAERFSSIFSAIGNFFLENSIHDILQVRRSRPIATRLAALKLV